MLILAGKIKNIIIMKTKFFFTTIIIVIIAVLEYFGIDKIILISIMFGVAVGFATWIFIECDPDEEDYATQKAFWCVSSPILFVLCCVLSENFDNENIKDAVQYAGIIPGINCTFAFLTTI